MCSHERGDMILRAAQKELRSRSPHVELAVLALEALVMESSREVRQCAIVGLNGDYHVFVVGGGEEVKQTARRLIADRITPASTTVHIHIIDSIPRTRGDKTDRLALRRTANTLTMAT